MLCFFKQKTAYEMRISDWSSDVCSSDLAGALDHPHVGGVGQIGRDADAGGLRSGHPAGHLRGLLPGVPCRVLDQLSVAGQVGGGDRRGEIDAPPDDGDGLAQHTSEEHTSGLPSLLRISYAVFCLKKKKRTNPKIYNKHKFEIKPLMKDSDYRYNSTKTKNL